MPQFPETQHSLLLRVQRNDANAWAEFCAIYRPLIYRLARRRGWQDADAQDLAQTVLVKVAKAIDQFRPRRDGARFRTWLTTVCRNTMVDVMRQRPLADQPLTEPGLLAEPVSDAEISLEHRRQLFRWAAKKVQPEFAATTWAAFWETAVRRRAVSHVAAELNVSTGAVYTARSRVMAALKRTVQSWDHDSDDVAERYLQWGEVGDKPLAKDGPESDKGHK